MSERVPATTWYPLAALAERINKTSTEHGFWPEDRDKALGSLDVLRKAIADLPQHTALHEDFEVIQRYIEAQEVRNMGEMLMLATSELAEALEEHRDGNPIAEWRCELCECSTGSIDPASLAHIRHHTSGHHLTGEGYNCWGEFKPEGILVELMDCVIRCLDTARGVVLEAGEDPTLIDYTANVKMDYNESRPYKHGRAY